MSKYSIDNIKHKTNLKVVFFWTHYVTQGCYTPAVLSQWYESPFTIDGITYIGILYFPSISNLSVPIIDDCTDSLLKVSACRYFGSINEGNMIIAGHSYKSIFGKLASNMSINDVIYFKDLAGNVYKYKLTNIEYLLPSDVKKMQEGNWDLSIFTCSYDNQKRITYRFELVN